MLLLWLVSYPVLVISLAASSRKPAQKKGFGSSGPTKEKRKKVFVVSDEARDLAVFDWLERQGGYVRDVQIAEFVETGLRGLVTSRDFGKDEVVASCPSALALALADPEMMSSLAESAEEGILQGGVNLLQWYIQGDKGKGFEPYLATLPTMNEQYSPTPDLWSEEHLAAIEFKPTINAAKKRQALLEERVSSESFNLDDIRFATWLASSRSFLLRVSVVDEDKNSPNKQLPVLCPVLDMINHANNPNARIVVKDAEKDDATFALVANRNIKQGTEITLAYRGNGATSHDLLLDYGFVPNATPLTADARLIAKHRDQFPLATPRKTSLTQLQDPDLHPNLRQAIRFRLALQTAFDSMPNLPGIKGGKPPR